MRRGRRKREVVWGLAEGEAHRRRIVGNVDDVADRDRHRRRRYNVNIERRIDSSVAGWVKHIECKPILAGVGSRAILDLAGVDIVLGERPTDDKRSIGTK